MSKRLSKSRAEKSGTSKKHAQRVPRISTRAGCNSVLAALVHRWFAVAILSLVLYAIYAVARKSDTFWPAAAPLLLAFVAARMPIYRQFIVRELKWIDAVDVDLASRSSSLQKRPRKQR